MEGVCELAENSLQCRMDWKELNFAGMNESILGTSTEQGVQSPSGNHTARGMLPA